MNNIYTSPLSNRYGSDEMRLIFSDNNKYSTWRYLWYVLACAERRLGLDITSEQTQEMFEHINDIDYNAVAKYERETKHDVMAHLKEFCSKCPTAEPIIHLGATSCYITDNTDILIMREALQSIKMKLNRLLCTLADFAREYAGVPTMAYTHLQPAQPTTIGKRSCMWIQDLMMDMKSLNDIDIKILGCNGATGTQASFLTLFEDESKVFKLNEILADMLVGNKNNYLLISGQTYTRKIDSMISDILSNIAQSTHKMCNDIRLLQGMHEICEPFGDKQVGSSAMAYKRNPIKCENVCSLSRHIISLTMTTKMNACTQWLERSLDDSANRRLVIPELFILTDHILNQCIEIVNGLIINEDTISKHITDNIPLVIMETVIMNAVKAGISSQKAHDRIRTLSSIARDNSISLLTLIRTDEMLGNIGIKTSEYPDKSELIGMAEKQVERYLLEIKM